jgi:hypothetical protein
MSHGHRMFAIISLIFIFAAFSSSSAGAYTSTGSYSPLSGLSNGIIGGFYAQTPGQFDKSMCQAGQDFILQIAPFGCTPAVVRSDLLEEQNVPVFCQISATKLNPAITVNAINHVSISGQYSGSIAGVSFFPAQAALGGYSFDQSLTTPIMDNVGYAVILLRQNQNESSMPDYVEANLTADIRYDIENAFGIGNAFYYLPLLSDSDWNSRYKAYSFWDGKGYLKADAISQDSATISIYSGTMQNIAAIPLKKGEQSNAIFLPGFNYCFANLKVTLDDVTVPDTRARISVDGDVYEVADGESFLNGKCSVSNAYKSGVVDHASIKCSEDTGSFFGGSSFDASISPKVAIKIGDQIITAAVGDKIYTASDGRGVYVGYIGSLDNSNSEKSLFVFLYKSSNIEDRLTSDEIQMTSDMGRLYEPSKSSSDFLKGTAEVFKSAYLYTKEGIKYTSSSDVFRILSSQTSGTDIFGQKPVLAGFASPIDKAIDADTSKYNSHAVQDYEEVIKSFSGESYNSLDISKEAYAKEISLANALQQKRTMLDLCGKFSQAYPKDAAPSECSSVSALSSSTTSSREFLINGKIREVKFLGIYEPSYSEYGIQGIVKEVSSGKVTSFTLMKNQPLYLNDQGDYIQLSEIKDESNANLIVRAKEGRSAAGQVKVSISSNIYPFKQGSTQVIGDYQVTLSKINLQRVARVSITPNVDFAGTKANFTVKIGIEKRSDLLKLSPEQAQSRINDINDSIKKLEKISNTLGSTVEGLKAACLATDAIFTADNLLSNLNGQGIARQKVMRDSEGWYDKCSGMVSSGKYPTQQACLFDNSKAIDDDVDRYYNVLSAQDKAIANIEKGITTSGGIFSPDTVDTDKLIQQYSPAVQQDVSAVAGVVGQNGNFANPSNQAESVNFNSINQYLSYNMWSSAKNYDVTELRDIDFYANIVKNTPSDAAAKQKLYSLLKTLNDNSNRYAQQASLSEELAKIGFPSGMDISVYLDKTAKEEPYTGTRTDKTIGSIPSGSYVQGIKIENNVYIVTLANINGDIYQIDKVYTQAGGLITDDSIIKKVTNAYPAFKKFDATSYQNPFMSSDVAVKYYETAPYKGYPAFIPLDLKEGWYVATRQTLPILGSTGSFQDSGRVMSFYIGNIGANKKADFFEGGGDDIYQLVDLNSKTTYSNFPGLDQTKTKNIVDKAVSAIESVQRQYKDGVSTVNVPGVGNVKVGSPASNVPEVQCEDFMSPTQCQILFNVCDPVICPSSRCNLGGAYNVQDVIQSGVAGSLALCLPNLREGIYIPVCLTGVKAGLDSWIDIEKSYQQCLQQGIDTGQTIGICDEIESIYKCDFFWRQFLPAAQVAIPAAIGSALGQGTRGGGEYLGVANAFDNAKNSVSYFTQYYAQNSYKAFQARSTDQVGSAICQSYVSGVYPDSANMLDSLTKSDSPPQFMGTFEEIPFTTATNPPMSQYKVFYHISAGQDSGAYYRVYLQGQSGSSYYQDTSASRVVDFGYIPVGQFTTNTTDFTAPSGYSQLCILVNGQEECGFKQVSTSFALNYIQDQYVASQASQASITTADACVSGTASTYDILNPNVQSAAQNALNPQIYNMGISRICSTNNPGQGTDPYYGQANQRWVEVGYCGDKNLKCWLDKQSLTSSIQNTDILNQTLQTINSQQQQALQSQGITINMKDVESQINDAKNSNDFNKIIDIVTNSFDKILANSQKGYLLILRGDAYSELAKQAFAKATPQSTAPQPETAEEYCIKSATTSTEFKMNDIINLGSSALQAWCSQNGGDAICEKDSTGAYTGPKYALMYICSSSSSSGAMVTSDEAIQESLSKINSAPQIQSNLLPARVRIVNYNLLGDNFAGDLLSADDIYEWNGTLWVYRNGGTTIKGVSALDSYRNGLQQINQRITIQNTDGKFSSIEVQCGPNIFPIADSYSLFSTDVIQNINAKIQQNCAVPDSGYCSTQAECQKILGNEIITAARQVKQQIGISDAKINEDTGAKNFECLVLQLAYQESKLQQCKEFKDSKGDPLYCNGNIDETNSGDNGNSFGIMQINIAKHPDAKAYEFLSNINFGINYLASKYSPDQKVYKCYRQVTSSTIRADDFTSKIYSGWARALREYNGWNDICTTTNADGTLKAVGDPRYVENVINSRTAIESLFPETCGPNAPQTSASSQTPPTTPAASTESPVSSSETDVRNLADKVTEKPTSQGSLNSVDIYSYESGNMRIITPRTSHAFMILMDNNASNPVFFYDINADGIVDRVIYTEAKLDSAELDKIPLNLVQSESNYNTQLANVASQKIIESTDSEKAYNKRDVYVINENSITYYNFNKETSSIISTSALLNTIKNGVQEDYVNAINTAKTML